MTDLEQFTAAYIAAIYFTDTGEPDQPETDAELAEETRERIQADCAAFFEQAAAMFGANVEQAGHDFWFTRNGHGVGFWDRPEIYGALDSNLLTDISKQFGEVWPYAGDDGLIYLEG